MNRVGGNRFNAQGERQPNASIAGHPNNVNRQNRNIANQPQGERGSQAHPHERVQQQERMQQPHERQHAVRPQQREQGNERHG